MHLARLREAEAEIAALEEELADIKRADLRDTKLALSLYLKNQRLRDQLDKTEMVVQAMWPIFALALAYGEHGQSRENIALRQMANEFRANQSEAIDIILGIVDKAQVNPDVKKE
jgi:hypothetical protein